LQPVDDRDDRVAVWNRKSASWQEIILQIDDNQTAQHNSDCQIGRRFEFFKPRVPPIPRDPTSLDRLGSHEQLVRER
jgi:hypothetical protein